eukprot:scaffold28139_cov151-Isochrysis_galbana.AAC.3
MAQPFGQAYPYHGGIPPQAPFGQMPLISSYPATPQPTISSHGQRRQPDTPEEEVEAMRAQITSAAGMSYTGTDEPTRRKFEENAAARFTLNRLKRKREERDAHGANPYLPLRSH